MLAVGLRPIDVKTGLPAMSAHNMDHQIVPGGPFEAAYATLPPAAKLPWFCVEAKLAAIPPRDGETPSAPEGGNVPPPGVVAPPPKSKNKIKFTCPTCGDSSWGKPGLRLLCDNEHDPVRLVAEHGPALRLVLAA
jgi:hypothetical protein